MALKTLKIDDFSGGRNSKATSVALEKNQTRDQVYTWIENGALVKMRGWSGAVAETSALNPVYAVETCLTPLGASGAPRLVIMSHIAVSGGTGSRLVYTDNGTTFALCETTPTVFAGQTVIPFLGMFRGKLYVSDGTNSAVSYDGTTVTTVAAFPKSAICAVHKGYVFSASGNTISWSQINDATTWPTNNFQYLDTELGDAIVAMHSWGGNLVVFCKRSMWLLVGDVFDPIEANYSIQRVNTPANFNFFAPKSVCTHLNTMKFLTADGFYVYTGGNSVVKISDIIQPDTDTIPSSSAELTYFYATNTPRAYIWKNAYYVHYMASSVRKCLVHDEKGKWWYLADSGPSPAINTSPIMGIACNLGSGEKLYGFTPVKGMVITLDSGYYLAPPSSIATTTGVPAYWISKDFIFPNEIMMRYVDIYLKKQTAVGGLGTLTLSFSIDGATYVDKSVTMMAGSGEVLKKRVPVERIGRSIKFKVANSEAGVTFEVYQIMLIYEPTNATRS